MSRGIDRYIDELMNEADRYESIARQLFKMKNKPSKWLDLWIGCRKRAWDSRMRAEEMAIDVTGGFNAVVRRHIQTKRAQRRLVDRPRAATPQVDCVHKVRGKKKRVRGSDLLSVPA